MVLNNGFIKVYKDSLNPFIYEFLYIVGNNVTDVLILSKALD